MNGCKHLNFRETARHLASSELLCTDCGASMEVQHGQAWVGFMIPDRSLEEMDFMDTPTGQFATRLAAAIEERAAVGEDAEC